MSTGKKLSELPANSNLAASIRAAARMLSEQEEMRRLFFVGPQWQIEMLRPLYGSNIDYYVQQMIPKGMRYVLQR